MQGQLARFPIRLREAMRAKGYTSLNEVAAACGLSNEIMRKYRTGQRSPTPPSLLRLAETLEVPAGWLIGESAVTESERLHRAARIEYEIAAGTAAAAAGGRGGADEAGRAARRA